MEHCAFYFICVYLFLFIFCCYYSSLFLVFDQLAKRNMEIVSEPKYLLRLDLINNSIAATTANTTNNGDTNANNSKTLSATNTRSHHLQADHANMKLLELELQRAVDEMSSVHCQRISRYMS